MTTMDFRLDAFRGPQPRDPPNGRAPPSRPRPPKPVQPRDDGSHRTANACYGPPSRPKPHDPWPRDPGNGSQFALAPRIEDDSTHRLFSNNSSGGDKPAPRPPKPPQPRDGGKKGRRDARDPNPRDPGI